MSLKHKLMTLKEKIKVGSFFTWIIKGKCSHVNSILVQIIINGNEITAVFKY